MSIPASFIRIPVAFLKKNQVDVIEGLPLFQITKYHLTITAAAKQNQDFTPLKTEHSEQEEDYSIKKSSAIINQSTNETSRVIRFPDQVKQFASKLLKIFSPLTLAAIATLVLLILIIVLALFVCFCSKCCKKSSRVVHPSSMSQCNHDEVLQVASRQHVNPTMSLQELSERPATTSSAALSPPIRSPDSRLEAELECPVCFEVPMPPQKIFQCSKGHTICQDCYNKLQTKKCPGCREDWNNSNWPGRNLMAETMIRNLFGTPATEGSEPVPATDLSPSAPPLD